MKAQRRAANGFLPAAVLACALFADLGHAGQWSRPGLRASLSGSSGGACSAGLPDGRSSLVTGGRHRGGLPGAGDTGGTVLSIPLRLVRTQ